MKHSWTHNITFVYKKLRGISKKDKITRITVEYHRTTEIKPKEIPKGALWEYMTWDYSEKLIIDRETDSIDHIQYIGAECKVSRKFEIDGGIQSLLETFDKKSLFKNIKGNPPDVIDDPHETKDYTIIIDYKINPQQMISGTYDKNGLPNDWAEFADTVFNFMLFYGLGEIFDPAVYGKTKRRKTDYIFCSVIFDEGSKSYYYLTNDDSIEIGDFVLVPSGKDNHMVTVEVVDIGYFPSDNLPFPLDKIKQIIGRSTQDDF